MQPHALKVFAATLAREHGVPRVLDIEHSIHAYRPTLSGKSSVASYYIRPPDGMPAETLIKLFEEVEGFERMNLTLVSILGLDTYHKPLISVDDFAKKYFSDNNLRILRVVGKSDPAIDAMAAFVDGLKATFDASAFPHHSDFAVSGYRDSVVGRSAELKILFKPADATGLMRAERAVRIHLDEINLGREITTSRHVTRAQAPELILSSMHEATSARTFLAELAQSLPRATAEEVDTATESAQRATGPSAAETPSIRAAFAQVVSNALPPAEVKKRAIAAVADILRNTRFADGLEVLIVQGGMAIEVTFPRKLWLSSSFDEKKHVKAISSACIAVKADPQLREGWVAHYRFDSKTGKLQVRAVDPQIQPSSESKIVPGSV